MALSAIHVISVAAGAVHTVALADDGHVWNWGNGDTMAGVLDTGSSSVPVLMVEVTHYGVSLLGSMISAGRKNTALLTRNKRVFVWGCNLEGYLGYMQRFSVSPRQVYGFHNSHFPSNRIRSVSMGNCSRGESRGMVSTCMRPARTSSRVTHQHARMQSRLTLSMQIVDDDGGLWECGLTGHDADLPTAHIINAERWYPRPSLHKFEDEILYAVAGTRRSGVVTRGGIFTWERCGREYALHALHASVLDPIFRTPCMMPGLCVGNHANRLQENALAFSMGAHMRLGADSLVRDNVAEIVFSLAWLRCDSNNI